MKQIEVNTILFSEIDDGKEDSPKSLTDQFNQRPEWFTAIKAGEYLSFDVEGIFGKPKLF